MNSTEETNKLFSEFPPATTSEWEEKIHEDLKGADYDKKLIWKIAGGLHVKPYYRAEDLALLAHHGSHPGSYPYVRSNKTKDNSWKIRQNVEESNIDEANRLAIDALKNGATALSLDVSEVTSTEAIDRLLKDISPVDTDIHYYSARNYKVLMNRLIAVCKKRGLDYQQLTGSFNFDPISFVLLRGDFYQSEESDFDDAGDMIESFCNTSPGLRLISVNGHNFHNSGSNIIQELAFSMASASDYVARLAAKDLPHNQIMPRITFILSSGSDYFLEIAKFRAARLLWTRIAEQYHPAKKPESMIAHIQVVTSNWNKTVYDPFVNMLRTTTEAMAAAIAGVDSITVCPFDLPYKEPDDFSRRIARNQQILLKEEVYLDKVIDPSAGSYYIEQLTYSIAQHAWDLFVKVEQIGGMLQAVKTGFIQDEIEKNSLMRQQDLANRRLVLLGTNQYPNPDERMLGKIQEEVVDQEEEYPPPTKYKTLTLGRVADNFEDLRLATEIFVDAGNTHPSVFLFTIGNLAMRKARAAFSNGFFACAGYKIIDNAGFGSVDEGIKQVTLAQPSIVVICSSDEEYTDFVPEICRQLKATGNNAKIVLAGYPKDHIESFRQAGIDEFIHIRSNLLETLAGFHEALGITL